MSKWSCRIGIPGLCMVFLGSCSAPKMVVKPAPVADSIRHPVDSVVKIQDRAQTSSFLDSLLGTQPRLFDTIRKNRKDYKVQIIYTQIDRGKNGQALLHDYYFNVDDSAYFYPASTVKFPTAILALQRLNELKIKGIDKNTTLLTGSDFSGQTEVLNDPATPDGKPSIANYIRKILLVSDNDAFNRLYEFLGQEYINQQMHQKGMLMTQIIHRLSIPLSEEENRHTNPVRFLDSAGNIRWEQPGQYSRWVYANRSDSVAIGYQTDQGLVGHPMNFSRKNRIPLRELHQVLTGVIFPYRLKASQRFGITEADRRFLLKYMSQLPTESTVPPYADDSTQYYPAYCKFLLMGGTRDSFPPGIRIFNKVGDAYGQLTDVAYIVDFNQKVEFLLSATIYCNQDGILNDDKYDYETVGFPFMKHLGQLIYQYELNRPKSVLPDLSEFRFEYDRK